MDIITFHKFHILYRQVLVNVRLNLCNIYAGTDKYNLDLDANKTNLMKGCPAHIQYLI